MSRAASVIGRSCLRSVSAIVVGLACVAAGAGNSAAIAQGAAKSRVMALTFDDLPFVTVDQPYFPTAERKTTELLAVLRKHRAPAIGFVNERKLDDGGGAQRSAREALLRQWIDAGMTLGNHTYSHPDFNALTVEAFKEEITRGEPTVKRLMTSRASGSTGPLFFRHPMTHTGNTREKKEAIDAFLAARGYQIAPHTVENSDFIFNAVYARAQAAGDRAGAARVRDAYVDLTMGATFFAENASQTLFRRVIPQTLLLHANTLNAEVLDIVLSRLEARGYRFITLEEATADAAYATPDTMVTASGPTWFWRWATTLKVHLSGKDDPEVPEWVMEAYRAKRVARFSMQVPTSIY
jgi:peptidoglycan/xylan/chitin deacetylase (PgdA/CDA1 family)